MTCRAWRRTEEFGFLIPMLHKKPRSPNWACWGWNSFKPPPNSVCFLIFCSSKTFAAQNGYCPRSEYTPSLAMEASNSDQRTCTFCRSQAELPEVAQRQVVRWLQPLVEKSIHRWLAITPPRSLTVRPWKVAETHTKGSSSNPFVRTMKLRGCILFDFFVFLTDKLSNLKSSCVSDPTKVTLSTYVKAPKQDLPLVPVESLDS